MPERCLDRPAWVQDAVFYQIFVDRFRNGDPANDPPGSRPWGEPPTRENFFGGDLAGIRERLPYLTELGITALYLTPIFAAGTNHRYDTNDFMKIDPVLGDIEDLRELVAEAHRLGICVILDAVFNHCGDGFWAFQDLVEHGEESPYRDWFGVRRFPIRQDPPSYQTCGGAAYLPKLNTDNPEVRRYLLDVATYWIKEADIDGWRLDVPWKVAPDFWEAFQAAVKSVKLDAYIVGEIWRDARPWLGVWDGAMNYRLREHILDYCVRDHMDAEDFAFECGELLGQLGEATPWMLNLLGSHDTPRLLTLCGDDDRRAILALTALVTLPGAPMLYYGDEIGMEGETDPDCRRCMRWDEVRWNESINAASRRLIRLRHELQALKYGSWEPLFLFNGVCVYRRRHDGEDVVVVLNPRDAQCNFAISIGADHDTRWCDALNDKTYEARDGMLIIEELPTCSSMVLVPSNALNLRA
jgi:cyclomaltodextrinase